MKVFNTDIRNYDTDWFFDNSNSISYVISAFSFMCTKYLFLNSIVIQKGIEKGRQAITVLS